MSSENEDWIMPVTETPHWPGTKIVRFTYVWQPDFYGTTVTSRNFSPSSNKELRFYLTTRDYLTSLDRCRLCVRPCVTTEIEVYYKLSFCKDDFRESRTTRRIISSTKPTEFYDPLPIRDPSKGYKSEITVVCDIELIVLVDNIPQCSAKTLISLPEYQITENLRELFTTRKGSDVTIDVRGENFAAHKAILSVRSPVFSAMFKHEMAEKKENRVCISDPEPKVFLEMLRFIYTDEASTSDEITNELLVAADKYQLSKLKIVCEMALRDKVTTENAADLLILADRHSAKNLKEFVIRFVNRDLCKVMATQGFQSMINSDPQLTKEVLRTWAGK